MNPESPSPIARSALMVERVGGALSSLTPAIQGAGCEVARAAEARAAVTVAGSMRRLSLVVVNGDAVGNDASWLIASMKTQHPNLPIVWFSSDPKAAGALPNKLDLVTNDLNKLRARITCLLREEFYSPALVQQVVGGARGVLDEFGIATEASEPSVTSNLTTLGEVNAYISFSGPRLVGHVVLSASVGDLTSAYRSQFPKIKFPGLDDVEDLLGEIGNQIVGYIKRSIQGECRMGLPHFIRGEGASIRHKAGAPTLVLEFAGATQRVRVELCIHRFEGGAGAGARASDHVATGSIHLL